MNQKCKFVTADSVIVYNMIEILYNGLEKHNGGLARKIVSSDNLSDEAIKSVLEDCNKEYNKDRDDVNVCKILCETLLRMTPLQRSFIFAYRGSEHNNGISNLNALLKYPCCLKDPEVMCSCLCSFKNDLNAYIAEQQCILEHGNNQKFIDGEYAINEV